MNTPATSGRTVIVGVSGGIAAYKTVELASRLKKAGHDVQVLMTAAAQHFVGPLTFAAVTSRSVVTSVLPSAAASGEQVYPHLYPSTRADAFIVAPATADVIARLANGLGDDAVTTAALSLPSGCRRYFAPAMNVEMWRQPVVLEQVRKLEQLGWVRLGPASGDLACGMTGEGRMVEPSELAARVLEDLNEPAPEALLAGQRVLILSGPTCEYLDPVRFISNASSGRMGKALAMEAAVLGATVQFVTGPVAAAQLPSGTSINVESVVSAEDLLAAGRNTYAASDIIIYAAAVADYRPAVRGQEKMPKKGGTFMLELEATPDVAATLNQAKAPGQVAIGFALQTSEGEIRAKEKMTAKKFDGVVLNSPDALGGETGTYTFFAAGAREGEPWGTLSKRDCARRILAFAAAARGASLIP